MNTFKHYIFGIALMAAVPLMAQQRGITDTKNSKCALMSATPVDAVHWTDGFWGERFNVFAHTSLQSMWETWKSPEGKGFNNFLVASGEIQLSSSSRCWGLARLTALMSI